MDLFSKCYNYTRVEQAKALDVYPYFNELTSGQDNVVQIKGRRTIMLGSNNYHPAGQRIQPGCVPVFQQSCQPAQSQGKGQGKNNGHHSAKQKNSPEPRF